VLIPVAFVLIAVGNLLGGSNLLTYGIFFVVVFVWIGISQPQWTSVVMAPLALAAYVGPLFRLPVGFAVGITSATVTIPACALVGESLAWSARRVVRSKEELQREQAVAQGLRELQQMEETWISAVSHELRTPITICRGHLEVVDPDAGPNEVRRAIAVVLDELERMSRLAEDVTTLAGLQGRALVRRRRVQLADFLAAVSAKAEPLLDGRLRVAPAPDAAWIKADPDRLTQALLNLLQNAALHAPGDSPVDLQVARDHRWWRFEVSDLGPGMPEGMERTAFEPFIRGNGSGGGSGLGLAIVRGIAHAHRGAAGVQSRAGEGVTFWVRIPA
jgi:signal transduction histidine kinase